MRNTHLDLPKDFSYIPGLETDSIKITFRSEKDQMKNLKPVYLSVAGVLLLGMSAACQKTNTAATSPATPAPTAAAPALFKNAEDAMPRVSVQNAIAAAAKGEAVLVDVRGTDDYKLGHINGAIDHGVGLMEGADFKGLPKNKRLIAYCSCPAEHSSARAAYLLQQAGFKDAGALVGGTAAWEAAGGEMAKNSK